jgi:sec-independent protein translocase protein TatC
MPKVLRPIGHEDRLSIVDHLDELRSRLIVCAVTLVAAFAACFVFNSYLLDALNAPLHHLDRAAKNELRGTTGDDVGERHYLLQAASSAEVLARSSSQSVSDRGAFAALGANLDKAAQSLPSKTSGVNPITIGIAEPFTVTLKVALYAALIMALPVLLYEAFAFVVPALTDQERGVVTPVIAVAPMLFFAGVVFTYIVVLPAAIRFLQGYNSSHFQTLIQAGSTYSFEVLTMGAIGLAFEMPLLLVGLRAAGVIDGSTLTRHWRYAIVTLAVVAAAMPGADPVTTGLETAPLLVLFVASAVLLKLLDRRAAKRAAIALSRPGDKVS